MQRSQTSPTTSLIAQLFILIGNEEQQIELERQNLAMIAGFNPLTAFVEIDQDQDGNIGPKDLQKFLLNQYIRISQLEAESVIKEYDGNNDMQLDFEEFCAIFLPATNYVLEEIALERSTDQNHTNKSKSLQVSVVSKMCEIIEKEIKFQRIRTEIKKELLLMQDFIKDRHFMSISQGKEFITVEDLNFYLRKHNIIPRKCDLEALLRRCDHEGKLKLNYQEFVEITSCNENNLNIDQIENDNHSLIVQKANLKNDINSSPSLKKSQSKEDIYEKSIDETMDNYQTPPKKDYNNQRKQLENVKKQLAYSEQKDEQKNLQEEELKQIQEQESENQPLTQEQQRQLNLKYLSLLKNQIKLDKEVEIQRGILFSHVHFNTLDAFKMFDINNNGYITVDELQKVFQDLDINQEYAFTVIGKYDKDMDGKLNYREFQTVIAPRQISYQIIRHSMQLDQEAENDFRTQWISDLKELIITICRAEEIINDIRNQLNIDIDNVFNQIDTYQLGSITLRNLNDWLFDCCGFKLYDYEGTLVMQRYGKNNEFRIAKQDFINEVAALTVQEDEEEVNNEQEQE